MRFLISSILLLLIACASSANNQTQHDYFFIFDGGVFIHEEEKPIEDFKLFSLPEMKSYSDMIQIADVTPDGDIVCALRGKKDESDKIDLVRITSDSRIIPLFTVIKQESLGDNRKRDRTFGDIDYDPTNGKAIFSVIERISAKPGLTEINIEYVSKLYQIPIKGGSCRQVYEYNGIIKEICAGGGNIGIIKKFSSSEGEKSVLEVLNSTDTEWFNPLSLSGDILNADLSPNGKSFLILEKTPSGKMPFKLYDLLLDGKKSIEKSLIKECSEDEIGTGYRYSIDGKYVLYSQKRLLRWGENHLTFLMTLEGITYPLVRDDFSAKYKPLPKPKNTIDIERKEIVPRFATIEKIAGKYSSIGTSINSQPFFLREDESGGWIILDNKFNKIDELPSDTSSDGIRGIFIEGNKWFALTELDLGERLISLESIKYGNLYEKEIGMEGINHDLHLSWNIGGRLVGLRIPEEEIFIGGDEKYIHMILHYPFKSQFPASSFVTPFYLLDRENWTIERSYSFGDYKTESHYFVKSTSDSSGNLYFLDSLNSRIIKYDKNLKEVELGWLPDDMPPLAYPSDMLFYNDKILVNDPINNRVVIFTTNGETLEEIKLDIPAGSMDRSRFLSLSDNSFSLINLDTFMIAEFIIRDL